MTSTAPTLDHSTTRASPQATGLAVRNVGMIDRVMPAVMFAGAIILAGIHYQHFLGVHRSLWDSGTHDRNSHYLFALRLATDAQQGRILRFLIDLQSARVWPPLHGVLATSVLLVGGLDYRLAVLPSLAAWVGTIVCGALVARRVVPCGGNLAGVIAALFIAASPAHRAYATDIMLESTGACLSLAALYFYLAAVQDESPRAGRWLGLTLTALFLHKYNYWLLVALALTATTVAMHWKSIVAAFHRFIARSDWRATARAEARQPLNYALGAALLLVAGIYAHGDRPFTFGGVSVSLYPPHNIIHAAYILVFLRLSLWWFRGGRARIGRQPLRVRQVVQWHAVPVALWLLLPKHPSYFLWFLSPANAGPRQSSSLVTGAGDYLRWAVSDYHANVWSAAIVALLLVAALASRRWFRPGGTAVLWLVLFGALLSVSHPNRKARFLHSWLAAGWVATGVGAAGLMYGVRRSPETRLRPWLAGATLALLGATQAPGLVCQGHALEGGPHASHPSLLELTDAYLDEAPPSGPVAVLTTLGIKPLVQWTYLERHGTLDGLEDVWYGFGASGVENQARFLHWLRTSDCDTMVVCEPLPGLPEPTEFEERHLHRELIDLLPSQADFVPVACRELPPVKALVTVWRRRTLSSEIRGEPSRSRIFDDESP